jgi:hypothetical protein
MKYKYLKKGNGGVSIPLTPPFDRHWHQLDSDILKEN